MGYQMTRIVHSDTCIGCLTESSEAGYDVCMSCRLKLRNASSNPGWDYGRETSDATRADFQRWRRDQKAMLERRRRYVIERREY